MSLIEFQDYPSTETPLNAENLNHNFNELNKANTYSEEEQVIGTWMGKPLYRKVVNFGTLPNYGIKYVDHNINNIENLIKYYGFCGLLQLPRVHTDITFQIVLEVTSTQILIGDLYDYSNYGDAYVTIEYTKTTD